MRQCKHPTCGETCRRPKKDRKVYEIKRTPILKKPVKIKPIAAKRQKQNQEYKILREKFLGEHDECEIKAPGICTYSALVVHHTNGRENERLLIVADWLASCPECNIWIEGPGTKWAYENGIKKHKHQISNNDR
jgi:hypothetical protein